MEKQAEITTTHYKWLSFEICHSWIDGRPFSAIVGVPCSASAATYARPGPAESSAPSAARPPVDIAPSL
jgi:hypothetical protein